MVQISWDGNELVELEFARVFQNAIMKGSLMKFDNPKLKKKIMSCDSEEQLIITSVIGGPKKIIKVEVFNREYINKNIQDINFK